MRQVCFAIVGKTKMHMSEMCVCEDAECLSDELAMAKDDFPEEDFQIVPLFTRRHEEDKNHFSILGLCTRCGYAEKDHPRPGCIALVDETKKPRMNENL